MLWRPLDPEEFDDRIARLLSVQSRIAYRVSIELTVQDGLVEVGRTVNLSQSGVLLEADRELAMARLGDAACEACVGFDR